MEGTKGSILEIWKCSVLTLVSGEYMCKNSLTYRLKIGVSFSEDIIAQLAKL